MRIYKYTVEKCSLTDEECDRNDCNACGVASERRHEDTVTFDRTANLFGLKVKANRANTIAMLSHDEFNNIIKIATGISTTIRDDKDKSWKTTHPSFTKLKEQLAEKPIEIISDKDKLAIVKYPEIIYVVAPLVESP